MPGMPMGKPAGVRCVQLDEEYRCRLFGKPERPSFCVGFAAEREFCGDDRAQAIQRLTGLELDTRP